MALAEVEVSVPFLIEDFGPVFDLIGVHAIADGGPERDVNFETKGGLVGKGEGIAEGDQLGASKGLGGEEEGEGKGLHFRKVSLRWECGKSPLAVGEAFALEAGLNQVGALAPHAELVAGSFDAEGLFDGPEAETPGEAVVEDFEVIVFELEDFAAINANEVIVGGAVEKIGVVGGLPVPEVNLVKEVGLGEEREGAVKGGAGGGGALFAKAFKEFLGGEVLIRCEDQLHDSVALGGLAETFGADERVEFFANSGRHHCDAPISN